MISTNPSDRTVNVDTLRQKIGDALSGRPTEGPWTVAVDGHAITVSMLGVDDPTISMRAGGGNLLAVWYFDSFWELERFRFDDEDDSAASRAVLSLFLEVVGDAVDIVARPHNYQKNHASIFKERGFSWWNSRRMIRGRPGARKRVDGIQKAEMRRIRGKRCRR